MERRFRSTPSRRFVENSRPTAHDAFGIRNVALFLALLEFDANARTPRNAGGIRPTGPPPFALGINFFVRYHLDSCEHGVLITSDVKNPPGILKGRWRRTYISIVPGVMQVLGFEAKESAHPFKLALVRETLSLEGTEQLPGVDHEQAFGRGCLRQDGGETIYLCLDAF